MARPPPPLPALRAFAAAGRAESLRDAANALAVTPSAISHQVRVLEQWVGAPLFERGHRQVRLTPAGRALSERLNCAFEDITRALETARAAEARARLRVSALPLFTSVWLAPRLHRFEAAHPDLAIDIDSTNELVDFDRDAVDVAIRNVPTPTPGLTARKLLDLRGILLCSPSTGERLRVYSDLANETLIHISTRPEAWSEWLAANNVAGLQPRSSLTFADVGPALEAAAQGRGVALSLDPLVRDAAVISRLVAPFGPSTVSAGTYFLVHRRADRARPALAAFADWIVCEMRADARRLWALPLTRPVWGSPGDEASASEATF